MKILVVNIPSGMPDSPFGDWVRNTYVPLTKRNMDLAKAKDTEFVYRFCKFGMGPERTAFYRYMDHLAAPMVFHAAFHAEEEGFDGVIINCCGDPMLSELRQAINIPVVGILESGLLLSYLTAQKIGIVHISPYNIPETQEHVEKYGMASHVLMQKPIDGWANADLEEAMVDCTKRAESFCKTGRELIAAGCDALLPACSLMSPMLRFAPGMQATHPNGLTDVDGVPIIDLTSAAVKLIEAQVSLKKAGSSWVSRYRQYPQPPRDLVEESAKLLDGSKFEYWDVIPD